MLALCLFGVWEAFFLELLILDLPLKTLFSDYLFDEDLLVFTCLLLSIEAFPASSISNGDVYLAIS